MKRYRVVIVIRMTSIQVISGRYMLIVVVIIFCWEISVTKAAAATDAAPSVGKLRSSAEAAFASGSIDEALKTWAKVSTLLLQDHSYFRY